MADREDRARWTCRCCKAALDTEWATVPDGWAYVQFGGRRPNLLLCATCWERIESLKLFPEPKRKEKSRG